MIDARTLDRTIRLERRTDAFDDYGTPTEAWAPLATLAARRLEATSREFFRSYGQAVEGEAVFRIRYVAGITASDRIVFDGAALELVEVRELGRREGLELRTRTQAA